VIDREFTLPERQFATRLLTRQSGLTSVGWVVSANDGLGLALFEDANIQDPYPLYQRMLEQGPIHRIGESEFFAVSSWEAVNEVATRCTDFSSNLTATMMYQAPDTVNAYEIAELGNPVHAIATADDPLHAIHRRALLPHLTAKRINSFEPFIADTANQLWAAHARDGRIEWMGAVANRLPAMIVARIIGIPDGDAETLFRWGCAATQMVEGLVTAEQMDGAVAAVVEMSGYISAQFEQTNADHTDSLLGDLAAACARGEIDPIAAQIIMVTLFSAGGESTASLIGSAAWILARHPHIQQQVREQPELFGAFLEEVLRYEPPFRGHYRHVLTDTELCGIRLTAGSRVLLLWGAANRDPVHFRNPDEFLLDRPTGKSHITFGKGTHFCVGAALARLEATIVLRELLGWTTHIEATEQTRWQSSLLVRRLEQLHLTLT
jgi:cytochrome P450